ncbi:hypothetical protein HanXRQr2_Chr04g0176191 [Helianthus annuus]|uniref:Uncharacterized protein n=1 Tax=Helianthus annuus TaxID=4232 RepID=A0A9K3J9U4_HELAN|nr:hypothetical protein HanXRQr2_Chr04g0176191 [Helianthus annuus]
MLSIILQIKNPIPKLLIRISCYVSTYEGFGLRFIRIYNIHINIHRRVQVRLIRLSRVQLTYYSTILLVGLGSLELVNVLLLQIIHVFKYRILTRVKLPSHTNRSTK